MISRKSKKIFAVISAVLFAFAFMVPAVGTQTAQAAVGGVQELIPGGMAFGVKFFVDGAIVLGTTGVETATGVVSPAKDCGLKAGDVIIRAGGKEFESASELISVIEGSGGKPIHLAYLRNGNENTVAVTPVRDLENGDYRIGVMVRDSTAGIGTVSFIDPETLDFGGLGHGIYDSETGLLLPLARGAVVGVEITDVVKSERNDPGELSGQFDTKVIGELWENSEQGVFGRFKSLPANAQKAIPVASRGEIVEGKAHILTTLSDNRVGEYEIEIEHVYKNSGTTKNFLIRVTDPKLLEQTGGIVQGMSGSPIIQNGKLIGAVTHVLVNDPIHGYGICIENMLDQAFGASVTAEEAPEMAA